MKAKGDKKGKIQKNEYSHTRFGHRLDYVMFTRNITNKELAKMMNVSPSTISGYRTGRRAPGLEELFRLAIILCVSTDYLLGVSDNITVV
jgi:transcriptional regulator with XRE-family HTH domain